MISSAVIIPEQEPEQQLVSHSLKRRQSSISSDSSKRPRLETQNSVQDATPSSNAGVASPVARRKSAFGTGATEEKKRGQRLFGALLGTLSQTSSKPAHRKRDEIEQRQRDRIRKDTEDREEEKRRKREELNKLRRVEQEAWDKESMRIRHRNMRAMAGFLETKTEPRLYYKPWELRDEEDLQIKRQIRDVEEKIRAELGEDDIEDRMRVDEVTDTKRQAHRESMDRDVDTIETQDRTGQEAEQVDQDHRRSDHDDTAVSLKNQNSEDHSKPLEPKPSEEDKHKEDDHAGEELVEGQEDDVIY